MSTFKRRAPLHTRFMLAESCPNLLDDLPRSLADLERCSVLLTAIQTLLQDAAGANIPEIESLLTKAMAACDDSKVSQETMLEFVKAVRGKMITMDDIRF